MKCKYDKLINKYFDNELDASLDKEIFSHLYICKKCKKQIKALRFIKNILAKKEYLKLNDNFTLRVMETAEEINKKVDWTYEVRPLTARLIPVFTVVILFLLIFSFSGIFNKKKVVSLEEVLLVNNYTISEEIVLNSENLSEYDIFRLTLN